ncbi:MAG: FAD-dependent oxidoreductase [Woeseiaceae bacterium]|nr:FAD-dependent oxidoreductase [Woeseiaceae bacterium]
MRIAIIGTGIAGNTAAWKLREHHDITVYEAADYVGGHTNTIDVEDRGRTLAIDTGFIVFNDRTYPNFIGMLDAIGQRSQPSEMSFSVHSEDRRIEYKGSSLNGLFSQRSNLFKPSFYRMVSDILRFNRDAVSEIRQLGRQLTLGEYLSARNYSRQFSDDYLIPMIAAIWSAEPLSVADMPAMFLVRFFRNHGLLQLTDRPQWRVIEGGSREYVKRLVSGHRDRIRLNSPVTSITRHDDGVELTSATGGREKYDCVFVASHSDQALNMLADPTPAEQAVLGAIRYQPNEAVLHTDISALPRNRRAWSAWNYYVPQDRQNHVTVSYNMNILQSLDSDSTYVVTLNDDSNIDPSRVIKRIQYDHPMYTLDAVTVQMRQEELNCDRTFYCGAYWRNGFHEDGVVSALAAVRHFEERHAHAERHLRRAG